MLGCSCVAAQLMAPQEGLSYVSKYELIYFNGLLLHVLAYEKPSSGKYLLMTYS
jgi:hypothetical protein